jgi:RHS repeat-associated protein
LTSAGSSNYSFDPNGNRTMTGYQTGTGNMLLSDGTWNYTFDNEGNVIQKVGISNNLKWIYAYDNVNHLTQATLYTFSGGIWSLSQQVTYQYDIFGNRVEEDVFTASSNTTTVTKFGYNVVSELRQPRGTTTGAANSWVDLNSSNQLVMRHFFLDALDSLMARMDSSGNVAWYLIDHLGSIRGLMNNSSSLIDQITFDAWGNISNESSSTNGDRYKFDGGEYSSVTGLLHFGARYYDPASGRWLSQDPLTFNGGSSNLYLYVQNWPDQLTDPAGTLTVKYSGVIWRGAGRFTWAARFTPGPREQNGFIIQEVGRIFHIFNPALGANGEGYFTSACPNAPRQIARVRTPGPAIFGGGILVQGGAPAPHIFYEIWEVKNGIVYWGPASGNQPNLANNDFFNNNIGGPGTSGHTSFGGTLYWDPGRHTGFAGLGGLEPSNGWDWWRTQNQNPPWGMAGSTEGGLGSCQRPANIRATGDFRFIGDDWDYIGANHREFGVAFFTAGGKLGFPEDWLISTP